METYEQRIPMSVWFWTRRFLITFLIVLVVLAGVYLARGRPRAEALDQALIWAAITAALYIGARIYHSSKGRRCELCRDMPEDREKKQNAPR